MLAQVKLAHSLLFIKIQFDENIRLEFCFNSSTDTLFLVRGGKRGGGKMSPPPWYLVIGLSRKLAFLQDYKIWRKQIIHQISCKTIHTKWRQHILHIACLS